jgi:hypothetical protein
MIEALGYSFILSTGNLRQFGHTPTDYAKTLIQKQLN